MTHIDELLSPYLDGELGAVEKEQVERHIAECDECRRRLEELKGVTQMVKNHAPKWEPPVGFFQRALRKIHEEGKAPDQAAKPVWVWPSAALALTGILAMVVVHEYRQPKTKFEQIGEGDEGVLKERDFGKVLKTAPKISVKQRKMAITALQGKTRVSPKTLTKDTLQRPRSNLFSANFGAGGGGAGLAPAMAPFDQLLSSEENDACSPKKSGSCGPGETKSLAQADFFDEAPVPIMEWSGMTGPASPGNGVARNEQEWQKLWAMFSLEPPPKVDFLRFTVIGIFAGEKPGYKIAIVSLDQPADKLVVSWRLRPATMPVNRPYLIRLIPRTEAPVVFQEAGR
ncbi:MAG: zf-HC2 domain-containing protein [Elusimicrobia bacterium]|nr:zf-HC2 domain-containing protein [Elusimicrobiota bacterium]